VREVGDDEVIACTRKLDGARIEALEVSGAEWEAACARVDPADRAALGKAAMRVREFHRKRIPSSWEVREEGGAFMGQRVRPLARVGIYVPGAKAAYPSSVIMNAVPASVVEVGEIVMATPPARDGSILPEVLMAARVAGVHRVFKMGGAQAVAALAFGTESVPRVDKIVGPERLRASPSAGFGGWPTAGGRERGPGGGRSNREPVGRGGPDLPGRATRWPRRSADTLGLVARVPISSDSSDPRAARSPRSRSRPRRAICKNLDGALRWRTATPEHLILAQTSRADGEADRQRRGGASATTRRSPWGTISPARITCCRREARRASSRRWASRTS
jgi:hypothetical protein